MKCKLYLNKTVKKKKSWSLWRPLPISLVILQELLPEKRSSQFTSELTIVNFVFLCSSDCWSSAFSSLHHLCTASKSGLFFSWGLCSMWFYLAHLFWIVKIIFLDREDHLSHSFINNVIHVIFIYISKPACFS